MGSPSSFGRIVAAAVAACYFSPSAHGLVDLVLRAPRGVFRVGEAVPIGLYAVSDTGVSEPFTALQTVLLWDPAALELTGLVRTGAIAWTASLFPEDSDTDGLNADCGVGLLFCNPYTGLPFNDGDAFYFAFVLIPSSPPLATPQGSLVTTLQFVARQPIGAAEIRLVESLGALSETHVLHAQSEQTVDVTGRLHPLTVVVAICGSGGDFDGDCRIGLADYGDFAVCVTGPSLPTPCPPADLDGDGDGDLRDFSFLQRSLAVP